MNYQNIVKKTKYYVPSWLLTLDWLTCPFVTKIVDQLLENDIQVEVFSEVKPNPTGTNINSGVEFYNKAKHDGVIALGGGSALDAAKAIALMVAQDTATLGL